jgi:hypothetical protein
VSGVVPVGAVRQGSWLLGHNRRGRVRWATVSRIIRLAPGQEIAWRVMTNRSVWTYRIEPTADRTRLTETRENPDGIAGLAAWFTKQFLGGQARHDDELEAGMASGLERIKTIAEY